MNPKNKRHRRYPPGFVKTVGLAGLAVAGAGPGALAAPELRLGRPGRDHAQTQAGQDRVEVSILNWAACSTPSTTSCFLKQALKWGVTMWDTANPTATA